MDLIKKFILDVQKSQSPDDKPVLIIRCKHHLAEILALFDVAVSDRGFRERENGIHVGTHPALVHAGQNCLGPPQGLLFFRPEPAQIRPVHPFVAVHQLDGIIEWHALEYGNVAQRARQGGCGDLGSAVHP